MASEAWTYVKTGMKIHVERKLIPGPTKNWFTLMCGKHQFSPWEEQIELKTPIKLWTGKPVNYSDFHIFGSPMYVMSNSQETTKLDLKSKKMLVLGQFEHNDSSEAAPQHRLCNGEQHFKFSFTEEGDPSTLQESLNNPYASFWKEAMQEEIKGLHKNKTWELMPLQGGRKPIRNKWVQKIKRNSEDEVERYRARLYATYDVHLEQLDVKTAFPYGNLEEEIYMLQPEDPCAYFKGFGNNDFIMLLLYVDDMSVAGPNKDRINKLKAQLARKFEMKDLGPANKILGMQIHRDRPISTPFPTNVKLSSKMSPSSEVERMKMSRVPYASVVGSLMFAMICTRPDIAYAVGVVSQYIAEPDLIVKWYIDSDYAGDLVGSKSTTGYVFTVCGGTVNWVSKLQSVVVMSTTEAEYVATAQVSKEAVWLKMLLEEMGHGQEKINLFCDNQSTLYLARNPSFHSKTKHIRVHVREKWKKEA
ncbi:retrovirus-related pol polyprotein from transposon TNT 1-94 [Tanacetum coccineum]|uniref:Retrovirus-related pol polyprotein from transposon TNT 1-94 n=1 Tax=Tanacetum coccineum TaxID=301880 RepID=A0ABQ5AZJ3_9ASTR